MVVGGGGAQWKICSSGEKGAISEDQIPREGTSEVSILQIGGSDLPEWGDGWIEG